MLLRLLNSARREAGSRTGQLDGATGSSVGSLASTLASSTSSTSPSGARGFSAHVARLAHFANVTAGVRTTVAAAARHGTRQVGRYSSSSASIASTSSATSTAAVSTLIPATARSLVEGLTASQRKAVTWWLGGSSAWVFSMVGLGGITRLTRSGLSMTDWKFTGEKPPGTEAEWTAEFARYKQSPEFKRVNISMALDEFKFIYWMEWAHRMWGRGLGLAFALPLTVFALKGAMTRPLASRLALLFTMGGTQAFVGWWMVRSGLEEPASPHHVPRVSPYRLAAHLTSAFAIYAVMVWTTLSTAFPKPLSMIVQESGSATSVSAVRAMSKLRGLVVPFAGLLSVTALSGAFVAGLDAGHAYNTFPLMGGSLIPEAYWGEDGLGNALSVWRNAFENTASVQFHHRCLAVTTLLGSAAVWKYGTGMSSLPRSPRLLLHALAVGTGCQVGV